MKNLFQNVENPHVLWLLNGLSKSWKVLVTQTGIMDLRQVKEIGSQAIKAKEGTS